MNEKTAEEKLRQALEGNTSNNKDTGRQPRRTVRRVRKSAPEKVADSFMEDFERKIEQSLHVETAQKKKSEIHQPKQETKSKPLTIPAPVETPKSTPAPEPEVIPEPVEVKIEDAEPKPEVISAPEEIKPEPEVVEQPTEAEASVPEPEPEIINEPEEVVSQHEPEPEIIPEVIEVPEEKSETLEEVSEVHKDEPERNENSEIEEVTDAPVEAEVESTEIEPEELVQEAEPELPEIPLISEEENFNTEENESSESENFDENNDINNDLPDIPVINPDIEEFENDNAETETNITELEDEETGDETESSESEVVEEIDDEENEESEALSLSPSADIVLNVEDEIPQPTEPEPDPEDESVPVSVVMPESTKTAEDKLMADIAEAMTGSPLTLESREAPEPYKIPDLLNDANNDPSKQSAEDKLIANIAQAISESPLSAAADNAVQSLEEDLQNLNELMPSFPAREEPLTEELDLSAYEEDPSEETASTTEPESESEKPETEIEATFEEVPLPEPVDEPDPEPAEVPEPPVEEIEKSPEKPEEAESLIEDINNKDSSEDSNDVNSNLDFNLDLDSEAPNPLEIKTELNEDKESIETEPEQEESLLTEQDTEVSEQNNMPEHSLLNDDNNEEFSSDSAYEDHDDFDINSLGAISEAASIPAYEEESEPYAPAEEESYSSFNGNDNLEDITPNVTPTDVIVNQGEEKEKEKVMGIREKMAGRKNKMNKDKASSGGKEKKFRPSLNLGDKLMPLLLISLLAVGGFAAWQLVQLNNRLSSGLMNLGASSDSFASAPVEATNPSYEYTIDFILDSVLNGRMAQRGKEGWQVVGSRRTQDSITGQLGYEFIFMRRTPGK